MSVLRKFREMVCDEFLPSMSPADADVVQHVIFMGVVQYGDDSASSAYLIDELIQTEEECAIGAQGTSDTMLTTDLLALVMTDEEVRALGGEDRLDALSTKIDDILKQAIFTNLARTIDDAKSTAGLGEQIMISAHVVAALSLLANYIADVAAVKALSTHLMRKAMFHLLDSWFDMCYGFLTSVDVVSDLLMAQCVAVTARFLHLGQAYAYFHLEPKPFEDLELASGATAFIQRVSILSAAGIRTQSDNHRLADKLRDAAGTISHLQNVSRNLERDKDFHFSKMEYQRKMARLELWVFVAVFVSCLFFIIATSRMEPSTNVMCLVVMGVLLFWMLASEVGFVASRFQKV